MGEHALRRLASRLTFQFRPGHVQEWDSARCSDLDDVGDAGITFEFGADPHLVHLAALGNEQLTNCLAPFDLTPTEPLGRTGASTRLTRGGRAATRGTSWRARSRSTRRARSSRAGLATRPFPLDDLPLDGLPLDGLPLDDLPLGRRPDDRPVLTTGPPCDGSMPTRSTPHPRHDRSHRAARHGCPSP